MAYEKTEVPLVRSQDALRRMIKAHQGFGLAVISEQDPWERNLHLKVLRRKC